MYFGKKCLMGEPDLREVLCTVIVQRLRLQLAQVDLGDLRM
jgi:hypothetical protein